jgi:3-dehydrotetronate 4-kinase
MLLGVIADDFTGASDIANTLAKGHGPSGGLRTALFQGPSAQPAPAGVEAGVVALKSRSIPAAEAVAQSLAALDWLLAQGSRQIVFKYCSTFDSTPDGNIGPVATALATRLQAGAVVVCPAFPEAGRTVYQGHLFVGDRPLHESGMQNHPLNPMTDPDLRRWLGRQAPGPIGLIPWPVVAAGPEAIAEALDRNGAGLVIVDALTVADLVAIGQACADARLVTGGSGIAAGLPGNFIAAGLAQGQSGGTLARHDGDGAVLAGSCSGATQGQVDHYRRHHPSLAIDVAACVEGRQAAPDILPFLLENRRHAPMAFSSAPADAVRDLQARFGRERVAHCLDTLFGELAIGLRAAGFARLVVAGGETSGAVVTALDAGTLLIGPEIDPGVPAMETASGPPLALALKSGNFGTVDFFDKALARLAGA